MNNSKQIAELEEELAYIKAFLYLPSLSNLARVNLHPVWARIYVREQTALAELRKRIQEKRASDKREPAQEGEP